MKKGRKGRTRRGGSKYLYAVPIFVITLGNWMFQVDSYLFRWVGLILSHLEIYNIEIVSKRTGIN